jgi:hypothetical protein
MVSFLDHIIRLKYEGKEVEERKWSQEETKRKIGGILHNETLQAFIEKKSSPGLAE